jgi:serine/threonine protein kinase
MNLVKECFICGRCFGDHNTECDVDQTALTTTLAGLPIVKNRYRLDKRIGTETFGSSYLAYDIDNKTTVALNLILTENLRYGFQKYSLFLEDVKQINHPNLISIFDYGKHDGSFCFIVREYLEWKTLDKILKEQNVLPLEQAINYISLLCEVINAIYDSGQMYHSIKLANIFINNNLKLLHLGFLSNIRIKSAGGILDLPYYISPEQCKSAEVDERSEVYSIGVLLYHLITGQVPFQGQNYISIAEQHLRQTPIDPSLLRPEISSNVASIILRALEKDPDRRFQTVLAFSNLLRQAFRQAHKVAEAQPIGVVKPSTEKLALANTSPKEFLEEAKKVVNQPSEERFEERFEDPEDVNKTMEVTRFENLKGQSSILKGNVGNLEPRTLTEEASLTREEAQGLIKDLPDMTTAQNPRPRRFSTISSAEESIKIQERTIDLPVAKSQSTRLEGLGISSNLTLPKNEDTLTSLSNKLAEKTYPLSSETQDSTKPLPPELQALFAVSPGSSALSIPSVGSDASEPLVSSNPSLPLPKVDLAEKTQDMILIPKLDDVIANQAEQAKENLSNSEVLKKNDFIFSPAQISYFFADKLLPVYKPGQYQRNTHDKVIVEREALASLSLVLAVFSLRKRKSLKFVTLDSLPPILRKKLTVSEDEKVVLQIINAGVKPLDSLEQSISKGFGRLNAISLYGLYEYFFIIADKQKIATSELINDAIADDLALGNILKVVPRDTKMTLEPGGSIRSYIINKADSYASKYEDLSKLIEEHKKEVIQVDDGQIKIYSYMLDYFKRLFCQHSYTFEN